MMEKSFFKMRITCNVAFPIIRWKEQNLRSLNLEFEPDNLALLLNLIHFPQSLLLLPTTSQNLLFSIEENYLKN